MADLIEVMAKAIAKEDWGHGRAGGEWSDELWDRLLSGYRQMERENPDIIESHYCWRIFRQARFALLALAEGDLWNATIIAGLEAYEDNEKLSQYSGIEAAFKTMLRSIATGGTNG